MSAARRAVVRWAWRMWRREWRQQILVLALLTAAVAASIGFASFAYTTTPGPDNAEFGAASHLIRFGGTEPEVLAADVAAASKSFDTHEVIYHDRVPVPGMFEPVDHRAQDPHGPLGGPRLALLEGAYPADGQVAITDGIADILRLRIGASLAFDGEPRIVAGIVENPGDLSDEFVLLPPAQHGGADDVTMLVDATDEAVRTVRIPSGAAVEIGSRLTGADVAAAVSVLVVGTVALLLIALIAAASFVVIAHRRMRQLGMLAAIGATRKQLRLVMLANGTMLGIVAAVIGATVGFAGWLAVSPLVEDAVGYRVDEFDVPSWLVASGMLLAVVAGTAAAWWPARNVARVPAVRALSGRPPEPRPARGAAALAAAFTVAGVTCLALGGDVADETSVDWANAALLVVGTVAVVLGMLFACPLAIRVLATCVGRLPVAVRLGIGDLARYRARSGAALAAISLAVGIAVAVIASATAAQAATGLGNLPENQVLIRAFDGPFVPEATELDRLDAAADRVVASFDDPRVTPLEVALDPDLEPDPSFDGREAITIAVRFDEGWRDLSLVYVATPRLLASYGYDLDAGTPGTKVITREAGEFRLLGDTDDRGKIEMITDVERLGRTYGSLPGTFATADLLRERGRWLVELSAPPTAEQLAAARDVAAGAGLTIEVRDPQGGLGALRSGATAVGILIALGILAMTLGLVRSEAGRDMRVLTATGATKATRRMLTAATAGGLALLGAVLGIAGAYLGFTAGFVRDLAKLGSPPILHLVLIAVGLPVIATFAAWLVAGREPADVARQPME
jgi:putative ABC transport system permease protein